MDIKHKKIEKTCIECGKKYMYCLGCEDRIPKFYWRVCSPECYATLCESIFCNKEIPDDIKEYDKRNCR